VPSQTRNAEFPEESRAIENLLAKGMQNTHLNAVSTTCLLEMKPTSIRLAAPFVTFIASIVGGGVLGALTNIINGRVSPLYFQNLMRWSDVSDVPRAAIAQGGF
jgi:hypothetical protein